MKLEVNGKLYSDFVAAQAIIRLDALSNTFAFETTSTFAEPLPFFGGEAARVFVDGELVLTGHIELVTPEGDSAEHKIGITGRDLTGDLLDSSLAAMGDIVPPLSIKRLVELVIDHLAEADPENVIPVAQRLKVIDEANVSQLSAAENLTGPEPGENAFDFCQKWARVKQVLLTSNAAANIVLARAGIIESGAVLRNLAGRQIADARVVPVGDNNVLRYAGSYDTTGRFNAYKSISQANGMTLSAHAMEVLGIVNQPSKVITDSAVRIGRQLILTGEAAMSRGTGNDRMTWERNLRRARGQAGSATVHGYRKNTSTGEEGDLWAVNELVQVSDDYVGVNQRMLINSVAFSLDIDGGRTTTLGYVEKEAYTLALDEPVSTETQGLGIGLFG